MLSVALFAMLLHAPARWQGKGRPLMVATIADERERTILDPLPISEPLATAVADPVSVRGIQQSERTGESLDPGVDAYLSASQLSERPQVLQDIDPEWRLPGVPLPVLVALLLINEYGDVDQVLLNEQQLSPMLEEDLRSRFLAMRFLPGRLHGRPVKSALRIEVRLE